MYKPHLLQSHKYLQADGNDADDDSQTMHTYSVIKSKQKRAATAKSTPYMWPFQMTQK